MCLAAPGKIVTIRGKQADVDYGDGIVRTVLVANHRVRTGDHVLVQMGIVIKVLSAEEMHASQASWANHSL